MKPYVCPKCDGTGKEAANNMTLFMEQLNSPQLEKYGKYVNCFPCKGEGIIWRNEK